MGEIRYIITAKQCEVAKNCRYSMGVSKNPFPRSATSENDFLDTHLDQRFSLQPNTVLLYHMLSNMAIFFHAVKNFVGYTVDISCQNLFCNFFLSL